MSEIEAPRTFDHGTEAMKLLHATQARIKNGEHAFEVTRVAEGPKVGLPAALVSRRPKEINPLTDLEGGWLLTLWRTFAGYRVNLRIRLVEDLPSLTYAVMVDL